MSLFTKSGVISKFFTEKHDFVFNWSAIWPFYQNSNMQYMSWKRHSSICLPLPFVLYICLMHCRDLWRFFFQLPEWLTHQIWTSARIGQKTRKQGSCTLFKQKSWKKNFPGIALEMVGEPKITGNFIIWREKKQNWLYFGAKTAKNDVFSKICIFS